LARAIGAVRSGTPKATCFAIIVTASAAVVETGTSGIVPPSVAPRPEALHAPVGIS
jgi:hypothetical protein